MLLAGTLINTAAVLAGGGLGLLLKGKISEKLSANLLRPIGLAVCVIGVFGAVGIGAKTSVSLLLVVASLALGAVVGEFARIEEGFNRFGLWLQKKMSRDKGNSGSKNIVPNGENLLSVDGNAVSTVKNTLFAEGFVTAALLFCVGAMSIMGPINSVINHDYTLIITKSILDFVSALILASAYGAGVLLAAAVVLIYQGIIEIVAYFVGPFLPDNLITQISAVGGVMILAIGLKMSLGAKFKTANMLPAFVFAAAGYFIFLH